MTPAAIASVVEQMRRTKTVRGKFPAAATTLRKLASLAAVLKVAERDWQLIEQSPIRKISKPVPARGRVRFLSADERNRLLDACKDSNNPYLFTIVVLALSTGMRLGEILTLRWEGLWMFEMSS